MADQLPVPRDQAPGQPGGIVPQTPILEKQTYASPMSYVGITRRATAWVRRVGDTTPKAALAAVAAIIFLLGMYVLLAGWYLIAFGLFGLFTIPFRLIRRSQRKSHAVQQAQLATMQAMMVQQNQALSANAAAATQPAPPDGGSSPELPPARPPLEEAQDPRNWT